MKKVPVLVALLLLITVFAEAQSSKTLLVIIKNPRATSGGLPETVAINWKDMVGKMPALKKGEIKVYDRTADKELPSQLEYRGAKEPQNLLVQVIVAAGKSTELIITAEQPAATDAKVYGRYVPERKDDFAWENDKIAFRMYGKALESTNENAFGLDVWAKRTDKMVIDNWYKTGDYHADHGEGLDYYSVGFTLGAGDIAPVENAKIIFPKNYRSWEILDNGPIRFTFKLNYDEWDVSGRKVKLSKLYSLDAGAQLNRVEAIFTFNGNEEPLPVAAGVVLRKEEGKVLLDEDSGIVGYWEPEHGADGTIGVGTIMIGSNKPKLGKTNTHLLSSVNATSGKSIVYYNGAAWNKAGNITTAEEWFKYLKDFKQSISQPLIVTIK